MTDNVIKVEFKKPEEATYWQRSCGSVLFYLTRQGCYCSECETLAVLPDES